MSRVPFGFISDSVDGSDDTIEVLPHQLPPSAAADGTSFPTFAGASDDLRGFQQTKGCVFAYSIIFNRSSNQKEREMQKIINDIAENLHRNAESHAVLLTNASPDSLNVQAMEELISDFKRQHLELSERIQLKKVELSKNHMDDKNKIAMQYVYLHFLKKTFSNARIFFWHHDSSTINLKTLRDYFSEHAYLIPTGVDYWLESCDGNQSIGFPIKGCGYEDLDYEKNIAGILIDSEKKEVQFLRSHFNKTLFAALESDSNEEGDSDEESDEERAEPKQGCLVAIAQTMRVDRGLHVYNFFDALIMSKGFVFAKKFVSQHFSDSSSESLRKKYYGFLLHLAVLGNKFDVVQSLLDKNADRCSTSAHSVIKAVYCDARIHLLVPFLKKGLSETEWSQLKRAKSAAPSEQKLFEVCSACIAEELPVAACRLIGINPKVNAPIKSLFQHFLSRDDLSPPTQWNQKFLESLTDCLMNIQCWSSNFKSDLLQLLTSEKVKNNTHGDISTEALQTLLCIVNREKKEGSEKKTVINILSSMIASKIQDPQLYRPSAENIHFYCDQYVAYQTLVHGKTKEELTHDELFLYVSSQLSETELQATSVPDVIGAYMGSPSSALPASLQTLLTKVREQSNLEQNKNDVACRAAFFALQALLIANKERCNDPVAIQTLITQWQNANNFKVVTPETEKPAKLSNQTVLELADHRASSCCACLFGYSNVNHDFLRKLSETVGARDGVNAHVAVNNSP